MKTVKEALNYLPRGAVFGGGPSLARMHSINKVKPLYRGATFWYYFRVYLPYIYPTLFILFLILSLTVYNTVEGNLLLGSVLSLFMGMSVLMSYVMIIPWRKHPSSLILNRTLCNIVFSVIVILESISTTDESCGNYAVATHLFILAGEGWLTTIAADLIHSLTNPFISYKASMKKYQTIIFTFSVFITFVFSNDYECQGQFDQGICWVRIDSTNSPCLWGYFMFWVVCMYTYQVYASVYAYFRLKKGLPVSFAARKQCAVETFKCLLTYAAYMSWLVFLFTIIATDPSPAPNSHMARFSLFFLFMVANRGAVDGIVWFMVHDFDRGTSSQATEDAPPAGSIEEGSHPVEVGKEEKELEEAEASDHVADASVGQGSDHEFEDNEAAHLLPSAATKAENLVHRVESKVSKTITELADLAIADLDETDLSPQVNMALRQQMVQYVTLGVRTAVKTTQSTTSQEFKDIMDDVFKRPDPAIIPGLNYIQFKLDNEYLFKSFAPEVFRSIRIEENISDEEYLRILSSSANERLSEGASGAFMFFCGGGEFIVKTIRGREARVLHKSLHKYSSYLKKHPESLLVRFLGSYSLEMFSQTFYFVVMQNCFNPRAEIQERFDIKGSWVGRSAEPPNRNKRVVCRHCNEYFVPSKKKDNECRVVVGPHEANVVLKDNDLRIKICLDPAEGKKVLSILKRDSDLLGQLGVLDYSLLIGVRKGKFPVHAITESNQNPEDSSRATYRAHSVTGPAVYHFGIVDFLQDWTTSKRIERLVKTYIFRKDPDGLSVMPPIDYRNRFQAKMNQLFDLSEDDQAPTS